MQGIENPNFDQTMYATFVPQDSVQKYVSNYGGPTYTGPAPTTLEGFLIPAIQQTPIAPLVAHPTFVSLARTYLPSPKLIFALIVKAIAIIGSAVGVVLFGGAITTFVCAFTPLCSITVLGKPLAHLKSQTQEIVEKIGSEVTADRVKRASDLLKMAIEKYQQMQI